MAVVREFTDAKRCTRDRPVAFKVMRYVKYCNWEERAVETEERKEIKNKYADGASNSENYTKVLAFCSVI